MHLESPVKYCVFMPTRAAKNGFQTAVRVSREPDPSTTLRQLLQTLPLHCEFSAELVSQEALAAGLTTYV